MVAPQETSEDADIVDSTDSDRFMDIFTVRGVAISIAGLLIDPTVVFHRAATVLFGFLVVGQSSWENDQIPEV